MIVKDEAHVIEETLECMSKFIDYYVISDTGSSDGTPDVIKNFFEKKQIPGEVHHDKWVNFGHNRTLALQECVGKSDYIWVIDADDIVIGNLVIPDILDKDAYNLIYGNDFTYHRTQIFRNSAKLNWRYVGVVHEYPDCSKANYTKETITGNYYVDSRRLGNRNKDPKKYLRDATLLEDALKTEPKNERYMFYLGQSYMDYGDTQKGIECYKKRIRMGGWYEEVFYSYYRIAKGLEILNAPWQEIESAYLEAYTYCKIRAEPIYEIAKYYRLKKDFPTAYKWAKVASNIKFPKDCVLFVFKDIYDYKILDELSMDAYYTDNFIESYQLCKQLIDENRVPAHEKNRILTNLKLSKEKLDKLDKKLCMLYVGDIVIDNNNKTFWDFVDTLGLTYNLCIVGDKINNTSEHMNVTISQMQRYCAKVNFDVIVMYNTLNLLLNNKFKSHIVLYMTDANFVLTAPHDTLIKITNQQYLNELLYNVNHIAAATEETKKQLLSEYNINATIFDAAALTTTTTTNIAQCSQADETVNGFECAYPQFFKTTTVHTLKPSIEKDILESIQNFLHDRAEPHVYMANYLLDKDYDAALHLYERALGMIEKDTSNKYCDTFKNSVIAHKARVMYFKNKYKESFDLCNSILKSDMSTKTRWVIENIRDANIEYIKNTYLKYPEEKIVKMTKRLASKPKKEIVLSMTSCKRFDLFEKTVNSFINCCTDSGMIDSWLCVDDNSSEEDRAKMKKQYPFFTYIFKTEDQKGHAISMNMIHDYITENNANYLLHLEDDWHFIEEREYIGDAIRILKHDPTIGQALFNKNYAEIEPYKIRIAGGIEKTIKNKNYVLHEHYNPGTQDYEKFLQRTKGYSTNGYWPHFSFRPSVLSCDMLRDVGLFYTTPHFEMEYAKEYTEKGYRSAFFNTFSCIHIGKKTWERNETKENAYNLNNTNQFGTVNDAVKVHVLCTSLVTFKNFKVSARNKLPHYIREDVTGYSKHIPDDKLRYFVNNKFNYRRDILLGLLRQIELWQNNKCTMIFTTSGASIQDTVSFEQMGDADLIYFEPDIVQDNKFIREPVAYILLESGKNKLVSDINITEPNVFEYINSRNLKLVQHSTTITRKAQTMFANINPYPDYDFYSQVDSHGHDIMYIHGKSIDELKQLADSRRDCVAFNTLGWLKHEVRDTKEFIHLYSSTKLEHGLYVKKKSA
jgi:hypothetical protein